MDLFGANVKEYNNLNLFDCRYQILGCLMKNSCNSKRLDSMQVLMELRDWPILKYKYMEQQRIHVYLTKILIWEERESDTLESNKKKTIKTLYLPPPIQSQEVSEGLL